MKASPIMFLEYIGMIGVPVLMILLALAAFFSVGGTPVVVLLVLIAAGCVIYGVIGLREAFIHGGKRRETAVR
jgi:hypothetical protein